MRASKLRRGDDFHGLGDLLDVADGLETALDLTESGIVGGLRDERGGDGRRAVGGRSVGGCLKEWLRCARRHVEGAARRVWEGRTYRMAAAPALKAGRAAVDNMARDME